VLLFKFYCNIAQTSEEFMKRHRMLKQALLNFKVIADNVVVVISDAVVIVNVTVVVVET
jgi:hypothetical protein